MTPEVRELIAKVERIGWSFDGYDGHGHVAMVHASGAKAAIPATPSEYRSLTNALVMLERIGGQKLPRPGAGHYRKGIGRTKPDPEVEASRRRHALAWSARRAQLDAARQAEAQRQAEVAATEASERRRRDIEALMR